MRPVKARKVQRALGRLGFELVRIQGSHHVYMHPDTLRRTTAVHGGKSDIPIGTLKAILDDLGVSWNEFERLL